MFALQEKVIEQILAAEREAEARAAAPTAVATAVVICGVLLALGGFSITVSGGPGEFVHDKWHEFQQQGSPYRGDADSRFGSVGTGRYDLWRAAVLIFRDHPLHGIGAGNFLSDYAILGRSTDQPFHAHSEFLETASTLGIPGLLEPDQVKDLLRRHQDSQSRGTVRRPPASDPTAGERLKELRRELNGLVAAWHHRTGQPHGVTHSALRKELGGPAAAIANAEQLHARISRIREWASRSSA